MVVKKLCQREKHSSHVSDKKIMRLHRIKGLSGILDLLILLAEQDMPFACGFWGAGLGKNIHNKRTG
jgi:hypothetical protein